MTEGKKGLKTGGKRVKTGIFCMLIVICVSFIFSNSLQSAEESMAFSMAFLRLIEKIPLLVKIVTPFAVRKIGHFSEFALLGVLLLLTLRSLTEKTLSFISWPLLFGLLVAVTDETIQLFVTGRESQTVDVFIDFGGLVSGMAVAVLVLRIVRNLPLKAEK